MKRKYEMVITNGDSLYTEILMGEHLTHKVSENGNMPEWFYALQDCIDNVLDLRKGESMYFQSNRDNVLSKGLIIRTV